MPESGTFSNLTDNHNGTYTATFTATKVGPITITATLNNLSLTSALPTITVTPITLSVTGITANNKTYDGTTAATLVFGTPTLQGVIGTDAVTLVTSGAVGTFSDQNVGTGKTVTVTGLSLGGAQAADYVLGGPVTTTANITPLAIAGNFTVANKTYDGTTTATITNRALTGVLAVDAGNVTLTGGTATFSDANAGNGKTVTGTGFSLTGSAAANYALTSTAQASAAPVLSGATEFSANSNGSFFDQEYVNTLGGDSAWNLYVTQPNSGIAGPFLNSGDTAATSIAVTLTSGTYTFYTFNQAGSIASGNPTGFFALNLFFDANNTTPRISVLTATNLATSPPYPAFSADSNANTLTLQITKAAASGSLAFQDGNFLVTLTDFRYTLPSALNLDRVSPLNNVPNGGNDFVGEFTLYGLRRPDNHCQYHGEDIDRDRDHRRQQDLRRNPGSNHQHLQRRCDVELSATQRRW